MNRLDRRNRYFFGLGSIGRDMFYSFEANTIIFFLSHVLSLSKGVFVAVSMVLSVMRIFDALNDPITGFVIDNVHTRWGKFKPSILVGGVASVIFYLALFGNIGSGVGFVILFALAYLFWDISYGINDIAYWTLLPALSTDQKQRERNGAFARICASLGMYIIMVGWEPITRVLGNTPRAWFWVAVVLSVIFLAFLCFPLFGVKEPRLVSEKQAKEKTTLRQMVRALVKNDQLMWTALAMGLFMVGYCTTTGFAIYYMEYLFGDQSMYAILAAVCGVAQLLALIIFPLFSKRMNRKQLYTAATALVVAGYLVFFFAERSIILVTAAALLLFIGQAFIQLLILMFLTDTIEYGQWKLHKRNESITFSIQPLVNKIGGALSTAIISATLILSGIKRDAVAAASIDAGGKIIVKLAMFVLPLLCIVAGYIIYRVKFCIDEQFYSKILDELHDRGELLDDEPK